MVAPTFPPYQPNPVAMSKKINTVRAPRAQDGGWFKFDRSWLPSEWPEVYSETDAMMWIASEANYADTRTTRQGELHTGVRGLAERFGWSRSKLRSFLTKMEKRGAITVTGKGRYTVILVTLLAGKITTQEQPKSSPTTTQEQPKSSPYQKKRID